MATGGEDVGIKSVKDLKVYNLAFELAMEIFKLTQGFPKEEQYFLNRSNKTFIKICGN